MNQLNPIKTKYIGMTLFSIFACAGLLMFGGYWIPIRITQEIILEDPIYSGGINQTLQEVEEKIKAGTFELKDNIAHRYRTENADITVIKMAEEQKVIPYTKYRIEIQYRYPHTVFSRKTKLDAILVVPKVGLSNLFADLFWSLE